jgi:hypothetical protein
VTLRIPSLEGSRREVTGITTLDEASAAIEMLFALGIPVDSPFHCYLNGDAFAIWTEVPK